MSLDLSYMTELCTTSICSQETYCKLGTGCCFHAPLFPTHLQTLVVSLRLSLCQDHRIIYLLVKIRFSLLLLSMFLFTLLSISIVSSPVGMTSDDLMSYVFTCSRFTFSRVIAHGFCATVCKTVRPLLSVRCPVRL